MIQKILIIVGIIGLFSLGWFSNELYESYNNKTKYLGMWLSNYDEEEKNEFLYNKDNTGQWVCVNVNKEMSYEDIVTTCEHEAGHELFARHCEDNPEICFNIEKELKNEKN